MMDFLNQTLVTLWGYPLSLLELVGVLTGFVTVLLASKALAVNFLFGLINASAYFLIYFEYRLYSMMLLQLVYFSLSVYGYYHWKHPKKEEVDATSALKIRFLTWKEGLILVVIIACAGFLWGWSIIHLQAKYPSYFEPPMYPWIDALIAMGSIAGQWLLSRKVWHNWVLWIILDTISTVLFATMGMVFTAVLFASFTLIALKALIDWKKIYETNKG